MATQHLLLADLLFYKAQTTISIKAVSNQHKFRGSLAAKRITEGPYAP